MAGDGQAVTITELRPPRRILALAGLDRPEKSVAVVDEQRATQTWYPGAKRASTQVHGQKAEPIVLRGWFQDLVGPSVRERVALARGLLAGGNLCRLVWGDRIERTGRVKRVEIGWHEEQRASYQITFEVDQADEPVTARQSARAQARILAELRDEIRVARAASQRAVDAVRAVKTIAGLVR